MSQITAMIPESNSSRWYLSREHFDFTPIDLPTGPAANGGEPRVERWPMWLFVSDDTRLLCPRGVEVEISQDEDCGYLASCERLHVFASGHTYQEAVDSLTEQVVHFYREYVALEEDDLIGKAIEIRRLYRDNFELSK